MLCADAVAPGPAQPFRAPFTTVRGCPCAQLRSQPQRHPTLVWLIPGTSSDPLFTAFFAAGRCPHALPSAPTPHQALPGSRLPSVRAQRRLLSPACLLCCLRSGISFNPCQLRLSSSDTPAGVARTHPTRCNCLPSLLPLHEAHCLLDGLIQSFAGKRRGQGPSNVSIGAPLHPRIHLVHLAGPGQVGIGSAVNLLHLCGAEISASSSRINGSNLGG